MPTTPATPPRSDAARARSHGHLAGHAIDRGERPNVADTLRRTFATAVADALLTRGRVERHLSRHELIALVETSTRRWDALRQGSP